MSINELTVVNNNGEVVGNLSLNSGDTNDNTQPYVKVYSKYFIDIIPIVSNRAITMMAMLMPYIARGNTICSNKRQDQPLNNNDIVRFTKLSKKTVVAAMDELVEHNVISRDKVGNSYAYTANKDYFEYYRYKGTELSPWRKEHCEYTKSKEWEAKRQLVLARDNNRCQQCNSDGNGRSLHVHHLTYKNFKNEPLEDLVTLCDSCHSNAHNKTA